MVRVARSPDHNEWQTGVRVEAPKRPKTRRATGVLCGGPAIEPIVCVRKELEFVRRAEQREVKPSRPTAVGQKQVQAQDGTGNYNL
ncbi:hypothetical protein J6590_066434 [Homalodisca vitripennis]|nr:hypothetical protein J6590_066434 [Homalodisca vitripennis]